MRKYLIALFAIMALVFMAACGSDNNDNNNASGNNDDEEHTLRIAIPTDMANMDLYDHGEHVTLWAVNNMFNSLYTRDAEGELEPDLAEDHELIDETTWQFTLKEGILFHNGDELTSEDVKYTIERIVNDDTLINHGTYDIIESVEVIDDYTFNVHTIDPDPLLLSILARPGSGIYPAAHIEEVGFDEFLEHPIGTGPYKFDEWVKAGKVTFVKNEDYFDGAPTEWDELEFRVIGEASTRVSELLTGGVDIVPDITSSDWDRVEGDEDLALEFGNSQRVAIIVPKATDNDGNDGPLAIPEVREAVNLAIDNQAIIDVLLGGKGTPTSTRLAPGIPGSNDDLFDSFSYDPEEAKSLLKEAGFEDGLDLDMRAPNGRYARDKEVAEMVVGMLGEVGINVDIELMEWSNYLDVRRANEVGDLHMLWFANSHYDGHILASEFLTSTRNLEDLGYENEELTNLLESSLTNMDEPARIEEFERAQEIIFEENYRNYLYLEEKAYGINEKEVGEFNPRLDELIKATEIKRK